MSPSRQMMLADAHASAIRAERAFQDYRDSHPGLTSASTASPERDEYMRLMRAEESAYGSYAELRAGTQ